MKNLWVMAFTVGAALAVFFYVDAHTEALNTPASVDFGEKNSIQPIQPSEQTLTAAVTQQPTTILVTPQAQPAKPQPTVEIQTEKNRLVIPSLGINASVKDMGLEPDGKMAVPNNFTEIGWYKYGTRPGDIGSAVMGAHVDNGGSVNGVFKQLPHISIGSDIYVYNSEGKKVTFRVTGKKVYDRNESNTTEIFAQQDKARLNLITCYGTWLPEEHTYEKRIVVFAELVQ